MAQICMFHESFGTYHHTISSSSLVRLLRLFFGSHRLAAPQFFGASLLRCRGCRGAASQEGTVLPGSLPGVQVRTERESMLVYYARFSI